MIYLFALFLLPFLFQIHMSSKPRKLNIKNNKNKKQKEKNYLHKMTVNLVFQLTKINLSKSFYRLLFQRKVMKPIVLVVIFGFCVLQVKRKNEENFCEKTLCLTLLPSEVRKAEDEE